MGIEAKLSMLRAAALLTAGLAVIAIYRLVVGWGTLEYGLHGYLILFGGPVACICAVALYIAYRQARQRRYDGLSCCHRCGYPRHGLQSGRCPECGAILESGR